MQKLLLPQEYADLRRCSLKTLERERASGMGCPYVVIGRRIYYRPDDVEAFHASRVRRSTSEVAATGHDATSKCRAQDLDLSGCTRPQTTSETKRSTLAPRKGSGKPGQRP